MNSTKAFTLLELILVLVIVGVLSAIAIPNFTKTIERHRAQEGKGILLSLLEAQKRYEIENSEYATSLSNLDITFPTSQYFNAPDLGEAITQGRLAKVQRKDSSYTLFVQADASVRCIGSTSACDKAGFPP
jgi:prepilin-type N-terminal cleavage/methylation domain-containing protein